MGLSIVVPWMFLFPSFSKSAEGFYREAFNFAVTAYSVSFECQLLPTGTDLNWLHQCVRLYRVHVTYLDVKASVTPVPEGNCKNLCFIRFSSDFKIHLCRVLKLDQVNSGS